MRHASVLLQEVIDGLSPQNGETFLDATLGSGGHAEGLLSQLGETGTLIALDQDAGALERGKTRLLELPGKKLFIRGNFRNLVTLLKGEGIESLDGALFDLGMSSEQIEESGRGFSFLRDEPLQMTMNQDARLSAADLLAILSEEEIATILYGYGEEHFSRRIAKLIVEARKESPITTSGALVRIVESAVPFWYRRRRAHPATKTFQALRIAVNDEYLALDEGLAGAGTLLRSGGRLAVITFHGGEVRRVKAFAKGEVGKKLHRISKKSIIPSKEELRRNPRARSAQLYIFKKQ